MVFKCFSVLNEKQRGESPVEIGHKMGPQTRLTLAQSGPFPMFIFQCFKVVFSVFPNVKRKRRHSICVEFVMGNGHPNGRVGLTESLKILALPKLV